MSGRKREKREERDKRRLPVYSETCLKHLREEENILGKNEITQKNTQDEDTEKLESESCLKQTSQVTSPTPTFNTLNFGTRFHRLLQHLRLLSLISFPKKFIVERVLMRDVCEIPVFQPLMKIKKRLVQQDSQVCFPDFIIAEKYWLGVVVNLEKRSITAFNCAAMKFTDASLVPYVNAYAMALPFMIRNFFKDVSMDTSKFSIKIVSEGFPQREFENNAATPIRSAQETPSNTLVLESNEDDTVNDDAPKITSSLESHGDTSSLEATETETQNHETVDVNDTVNDDATESTSSRESHGNTFVLEATETETQNHETVDGVELPLPHESNDMMDDVATSIIDPQEMPRGKM
ncbi:hypothetical protein F2Q68_00021634 [Brassica cretica]|uniref:Ubiquitin-like protease family profile domain-containing protein n=1 Tax=Brassica cretica TaxID=69181 RepID=A0A8S9FY31_BRACR|nr:hypothetical protein F2Q68_00021634 [Brassica cretica]